MSTRISFDNGETFMVACESCGGLHDGRNAMCESCLNFETLTTLLTYHCTPTEVDSEYQQRVKPEQRVRHLLDILDEQGIKAMLESFAERETL